MGFLILPCCLLAMCTVRKDNTTNVNEKEKLMNQGRFEKIVSDSTIDFNDTTGSLTDFFVDENWRLKLELPYCMMSLAKN